MMAEADHDAVGGEDAPGLGEDRATGASAIRKPWSTPAIRVMKAGNAENGFTNTRDDGQLSRS